MGRDTLLDGSFLMTKQEEIREGMEKLITQWIIKHYPIGTETFSNLVKRIQEFEDSQGVVIKVDRELPKHRLNKAELVDEAKLIYELKEEHFCFTEEYKVNYIRGYSEAEHDMLEANYEAVEPLI